MSEYTCAIYCEDFRDIYKLIYFYGCVLKLKIKYVVVTVKQNGYMSLFSKDTLFEMAKENILEGLNELDYEVNWKINFDIEKSLHLKKVQIYA